jgi:hypothetical protein
VHERGLRRVCKRIGAPQVMSYRGKCCPRLKNRKREIVFSSSDMAVPVSHGWLEVSGRGDQYTDEDEVASNKVEAGNVLYAKSQDPKASTKTPLN